MPGERFDCPQCESPNSVAYVSTDSDVTYACDHCSIGFVLVRGKLEPVDGTGDRTTGDRTVPGTSETDVDRIIRLIDEADE